MVGRIGNNAPIASTRRYFGFTQDEFAEFAGEHKETYSLHERKPDLFRVRELQLIADKLPGDQRVKFVDAVLETIFGKGYQVSETN